MSRRRWLGRHLASIPPWSDSGRRSGDRRRAGVTVDATRGTTLASASRCAVTRIGGLTPFESPCGRHLYRGMRELFGGPSVPVVSATYVPCRGTPCPLI